jgi:dTDP-4-amino-4,6-dideoxygalactose transaminase
VKYVSLFTNGTLALICALRALNLKGDVITTPYSFVATSHALIWNNLNPIFVDIEPTYCNIDVSRIEEALTPNTSAILPVHVYGNPANWIGLKEIADKHKLKIIYDAAHAFGIKYKGNSILNFGDLSVLSFHATKPFNTMEGGAVISQSFDMKKKIDLLRNFGFENETNVVSIGLNAKMNELQAIFGILQLKRHEECIKSRNQIAEKYRSGLSGINGISIQSIFPDLEKYSYPYFPIFIDENVSGIKRDELYEFLKQQGYYSRRYFFPLINQLPPYVKRKSESIQDLRIAEKKSKEVLCLPIYEGLKDSHINKIIDLIVDKTKEKK